MTRPGSFVRPRRLLMSKELETVDPDVVFLDPMSADLFSGSAGYDALEIMKTLYEGCTDLHCIAMGHAVPTGGGEMRPKGDLAVRIRDMRTSHPVYPAQSNLFRVSRTPL